MAGEKTPLLLPGKRQSWRPTGVSVLEMFDSLGVLQIHTGSGIVRKVSSKRNPGVDRVLAMLDLDISLYTRVEKTK
jgi:hypothetical protein